jgi:hypothetical protein
MVQSNQVTLVGYLASLTLPPWQLPSLHVPETIDENHLHGLRGLSVQFCKHTEVKCPSLNIGGFNDKNQILMGLI